MEQLATKEEIRIEVPTKKIKKALMVIAFKNFKDEEYFVPKEILEKGGVEVKTASTKLGTAFGVEGGEANVDFLISEKKLVDKFDAIIFVGGPGCLEDLDNENSYLLAKEAVAKNKLLAAICISPVILAKAGVLRDKKATVWTSPFDKSSIKILEENGAEFIDQKVVRDGKIITANGPVAAEEFGRKILENL
ncbi:MAG TPA: DJ-1/PfpI family protein [Candidatus Pacearchaeota archaeon]|nr:DJ-1/PfpI family protein [Candidatus Pacearchaeota archaeon]HOK94405.1 DJ-1/PfpI family protein [Candidatus Pacearchaeota archaeon]HPO75478.1 DJ-1/PfpI family protein [Candidatus Pacearchaeota archaeon]